MQGFRGIAHNIKLVFKFISKRLHLRDILIAIMNNTYISPLPFVAHNLSPLYLPTCSSKELIRVLSTRRGLFILQNVFREEWIVLGKAFRPAMPDWNLKHNEKMMGESSGGLPSERLVIFRSLLHLLDLGHHRQIAKACPALQLPLFQQE